MSSRARTMALGIALAFASLIALMAWGHSSPIGSAPDDDFHMASMWCPPPISESGCKLYYNKGRLAGVYLPSLIAKPNCYAFRPKVTGACQEKLSLTDSVRTERVNQGSYPGPYYHFGHLFVTDDPVATVLRIRDFNAALAVVLIGAAVLVTRRALRPALAWAVGCSIVPMAMSIVPSINPSSWAFSGLTAFWMACFAMARASTLRHRLTAGAVAGVGAVVALVARNDSALYVFLGLAATAALYFLSGRRRPTPAPDGHASAAAAPDAPWFRRWLAAIDWRTVAPWVVLVAFSLALSVWSFTSAQSSAGIQADAARSRRDPIGLLLYNIMESLKVPAGLLGMAQLGWNDVNPPALVYLTSIAITGFVLMTGLRQLGWRKAIALAGVGGTLLILPLVMLQQAMAYVGDQVQPRYFMAVLPMLIGVALLSSDGRRVLRFGRWQGVFAWFGLAFANALMLWLNLHRYVLGVYAPFTLDEPVDWWWTFGPSPMPVWVIGAIAFAGALFVLVWVSIPPLGARRSAPDAATSPAGIHLERTPGLATPAEP